MLIDANFQRLYYDISMYRGDEFFKVLVKHLAEALGIYYVIAGRISSENGKEVCNTISVWAGDRHIPNISYSLSGTPCGNVANQQMCYHPDNIQSVYPEDILLVEMKAESYIGMPMVNTEGQTLGILVALDTKPIEIEKKNLALSLLTIFATRASAELQFQDQERKLQQLVDERTQELMNAKEEAETKARQDPLTGLANRRELLERGIQINNLASRYKHPLSIVMIDIDFFKVINNTYGHQAGDESLKLLAEIIKKSIRTTDVASRFGGEEFIIILSETSLRNAVKYADRLQNKIGKIRVPTENDHFTITVSIGISYRINEDDTFEQLLSKADKAMYDVKKKGRNGISVFAKTIRSV